MSTIEPSLTSDTVREIEARVGRIKHLYVDDRGDCWAAVRHLFMRGSFVCLRAYTDRNGDFNAQIYENHVTEGEAIEFIERAKYGMPYLKGFPTPEEYRKMCELHLMETQKEG